MRFQIEVNTLDRKLTFEKETPADALRVAEGSEPCLGVTITDTQEGKTYGPEDFRKRFGN
jgi:hypothetical protein